MCSSVSASKLSAFQSADKSQLPKHVVVITAGIKLFDLL